MLINILLHSS
ncbi:hypothetical protein Ccrd_017284 [Cynara cardunculus var. scolymus]|uniref:Uncharacterized protein n=1 Tax=Cynara cardunculus var. scolymus TaxID=59895 RepID=A0A103Y8C1_CYNCS|nr:hypothetical protein Ccrd_017284 [Cynara cardunculus var. scolymus]